jgi:hypothetical protein
MQRSLRLHLRKPTAHKKTAAHPGQDGGGEVCDFSIQSKIP